MPSLTRLFRALCGGDSATRPHSHRPDFRARLSLNSLELLEDRATPSAGPADPGAWSAELAAMPATQSLGGIKKLTNVTGNGGVNVIDVQGDIKASLVLTGTASEVYIVNVHGNLSLQGNTSLGLGGAETAGHVIYNFVGAHGIVLAQGGAINGTVLAPTYAVNLHGTTVNGQLFSAGPHTNVVGGAVVNPVPFVPPSNSVANGTISGHSLGTTDGHNFFAYGGMQVTLTGLDVDGHTVLMTTWTDDFTGAYTFTGLRAGTYTVTFDGSSYPTSVSPGTVDGASDGNPVDSLAISGIDLLTGDSVAANYDIIVHVPS